MTHSPAAAAGIRPIVIIHNSISVDGATTGFLPHLGQHYDVAEELRSDARLVGSATMVSGLTHGQGSRTADPGPRADRPPRGRQDSPYWFVVDSAGLLQGHLHELRAFPGLRDVVVLVAQDTPPHYLAHLSEREYDYFQAGHEHVMLAQALPWIAAKYGVRRILVDSGPTLTAILLDHDLVDEISLLVQPIAVGATGRRLFEHSAATHHLSLVDQRPLDHGVVHLRYRVIGPEPALK